MAIFSCKENFTVETPSLRAAPQFFNRDELDFRARRLIKRRIRVDHGPVDTFCT